MAILRSTEGEEITVDDRHCYARTCSIAFGSGGSDDYHGNLKVDEAKLIDKQKGGTHSLKS